MKCEKCNKEFETEQAKNQHYNAVHSEIKKEKEFHVSKVYIYGSLIIIILLASFFFFFSSSAKYTPLQDSDHILGNESAKVTLIEYSDFQCPFCKRLYDTAEKQIVDEYVETGKVRFIYRQYPLTQAHELSQKAAEASECASDQDKFWEYHDLLFENSPSLSPPQLKKYAQQLNLNMTSFDACLDSGSMTERVQNDIVLGNKVGVSSTPSSYINGKPVIGSQPFSTFKNIIDNELKK